MRIRVVVMDVEGDVAALSGMIEAVLRPGSAEPMSVSLPAGDAGAGQAGKPVPLLNHQQQKKMTGSKACRTGKPLPAADAEREEGTFRDRALDVIRNSHSGVTSEEIYRAIECSSIQSAYQACRWLEQQGKIQRTDTGAWKAIANA